MPGRRRKSWSLKIRSKVICGRQRLLAVIRAWPSRQHGPRNATIISANRVWDHLLAETRVHFNKLYARGFGALGIKTI
jgi:hypothetical protein